MLISINKQHLYLGWLCILGIQIRFWASLIYVEHCSMLPLIRICYTLSWPQHQIVVTLVQLECKGSDWSSCFHTLILMVLCFLNNIMQDLRKRYTLSWSHNTMTLGHDLGIDAIWQLNCLLMRTIASFLRYTCYLNFINGPIIHVLLLILVHVQLLSCLFF